MNRALEICLCGIRGMSIGSTRGELKLEWIKVGWVPFIVACWWISHKGALVVQSIPLLPTDMMYWIYNMYNVQVYVQLLCIVDSCKGGLVVQSIPLLPTDMMYKAVCIAYSICRWWISHKGALLVQSILLLLQRADQRSWTDGPLLLLVACVSAFGKLKLISQFHLMGKVNDLST